MKYIIAAKAKGIIKMSKNHNGVAIVSPTHNEYKITAAAQTQIHICQFIG